MDGLLIGSTHPHHCTITLPRRKSRPRRSQAADHDADRPRRTGDKRRTWLTAYARTEAEARSSADGLEAVAVRPASRVGVGAGLGEGTPLAAAVDLQLDQRARGGLPAAGQASAEGDVFAVDDVA